MPHINTVSLREINQNLIGFIDEKPACMLRTAFVDRVGTIADCLVKCYKTAKNLGDRGIEKQKACAEALGKLLTKAPEIFSSPNENNQTAKEKHRETLQDVLPDLYSDREESTQQTNVLERIMNSHGSIFQRPAAHNDETFALEKSQEPTIVNIPQQGPCIRYSEALYTSYTRVGLPKNPHQEHINQSKVPQNWVMDVQQSLFGQSPRDPSFSGLQGILNECLPLFHGHDINPNLIKTTYFPGAGSFQELPLMRSLFPNMVAVAVDPLPMLDADQYNLLFEHHINTVLSKNDQFRREDATNFELPENTDMIVIRHPHYGQARCWEGVFNKINENPNWQVLLLTTMHSKEMNGFKESSSNFVGFKSCVNKLKIPGDVIYEGTSPSALPLINPEEDPPAGIDLYYMVLIRPPKQAFEAQSSA